MRLGAVTIDVVSDGLAWSDGGATFGLVPRTLWEKVVQPDAQGRVAMTLNCLLIRGDGRTILVDTGLGDKLSDKERAIWNIAGHDRLLAGLAALGVKAEDVDIVINTHLHADHCGGNTRVVDGNAVPTFSRALYYMQRRELADASYPNERTQATYRAANFMPLVQADKVRLLNGSERVTPSVECLITRGHTHDHQSVVIRSQGQTAIFLADAAARAVNMERLAWVPAFDVEPLESIETKRWLQRWALEENVLLIFQHDPHIAVGRLHRDGQTLHVEPWTDGVGSADRNVQVAKHRQTGGNQ